MKKLTLLLLAIASTAFAGQPGKEFRSHYVVTDRARTPLYYATSANKIEERETSNIILLKNVITGQRITINVHSDYQQHETTTVYMLDKKNSVTVRYQTPFISASTLRESIAENKQHREEFSTRDIPVTVESKGHFERLTEKRWKKGDRDSVDTHDRVKKAVDPAITAAIKALIPVLSFPDLSAACATVPFVTDGAKCMGDTGFMFATIAPDCDFDAEFDMPCGIEQWAKAKTVAQSGHEGRY